jgi:DNA polymerase-3 subunit epsilon
VSTRTVADKADSRSLDALPEFPLFEWAPDEVDARGSRTEDPEVAGARRRARTAAREAASFTLIELELDLPFADEEAVTEAARPEGPQQSASATSVLPEADEASGQWGRAAVLDDGAEEDLLLPFDVEVVSTVDPTLPQWAGMLGVFDLETTGVDTDTARIVSAHVGVLDEDGVLVERREWLVDPGVEIPAGASAVHGISTERARRYGRAPGEVVGEILDAIRSVERRGIPLVVYNAPYDLTLLAREAARHGVEPLDGTGLVLDPLVLDRALDRYRSGKRTLTATAGHYGVELLAAHEAGADAVAAGRLAQELARRFPVELGVSADQLHAMQVEWCREQTARFEEYMRRTKDASFTASGLWPCR